MSVPSVVLYRYPQFLKLGKLKLCMWLLVCYLIWFDVQCVLLFHISINFKVLFGSYFILPILIVVTVASWENPTKKLGIFGRGVVIHSGIAQKGGLGQFILIWIRNTLESVMIIAMSQNLAFRTAFGKARAPTVSEKSRILKRNVCQNFTKMLTLNFSTLQFK